MTRLDRSVLDWFVAHRNASLTHALDVITALGSTGVLVPLIVVVGFWWWRRRGTARSLLFLACTYLGAEVLFQSMKALTHRARPPRRLAVHQFVGYAFPSGHATLATAVWGAFAVVLSCGRPPRTKVVVWAGAALVAVLVGVSRLYLGAHWLTDVGAGWATGALWLAIVVAVFRRGSTRRAPVAGP